MALQAQAQLLDELMGKYRNVAPGEKGGTTRYDDDDVCKYYLCGFCPHDLFVNTKADLGPCSKMHDDELKRQYEKSSRFGKLGYEDDFERFLRSLLLDVEKKIKRGNERLKLTQSEAKDGVNPLQVKQEKVAELKEQINELIKEAESLGEEGRVEEAQQTLEACEKVKAECRYLESQIEQSQHNIDQKQMEVCEVCGSFLIVNDAQARVEEHINGKQHMGYAKVKQTLDDIRQKRTKEYEEKEKQREKERERRRESEKERYRRDDQNKQSIRDRKRSRSRDRKRKSSNHRSRSRSRSRNDKKRSRSRDRRRSKDLRHRSKSRDRNEKNGHDKKSKRSSSKSKDINNKILQNNIKEDGEIELGELKSESDNEQQHFNGKNNKYDFYSTRYARTYVM